MVDFKKLEREPTREMVEAVSNSSDQDMVISYFTAMWDAAPVVYDEEDHPQAYQYKRGDRLRIKADFVPGHSGHYLTEGKVYDAIVSSGGPVETFVTLVSDSGNKVLTGLLSSVHIREDRGGRQGTWEVVEDDS